MNNKKTIILTFSLATILILGILVFSNGVQTIWQASSEVENNIDVSNTDNVLLSSNFDYSYDSILNMPDESFRAGIIKESIATPEEEFAPLQDSVNIVGEFIKLNYGLTQAQNNTAYVDYVFQYGMYSPEIFYFINIDGNIFSATLSGFTNEVMWFGIEHITNLADDLEIYNGYDEDSFTSPIDENNISLINSAINETLSILGYSSEITSSEYSKRSRPCSNKLDDGTYKEDDLFAEYVAKIKLNDNSILEFTFLKAGDNMILENFVDFTLYDKHSETALTYRTFETKNESNANLKLDIDFNYKSQLDAKEGSPFLYVYDLEFVTEYPEANVSLQDASNIIGEYIITQFPDVSPSDIKAYINYLYAGTSGDFPVIDYYATFNHNGADIYVKAAMNSMTFEVLRVGLYYYDKNPENSIPVSLKEVDTVNFRETPVEEDIKSLINENFDKTLDFLGYQSEVDSITYETCLSGHFSDNPIYYLAYECKIFLTDGTNISALYSGDNQSVYLESFFDKSAQDRYYT